MKRKKRTEKEWSDIQLAWETSGKTQQEYCAENKIPISSFCIWRTKLKDFNATKHSLVKIEKISDLPDNVEELKRLPVEKNAIISELRDSNELLSEQVRLLKKYRFARSCERWTAEDKAQLYIFDEAEALVNDSSSGP